MNNLFGIFKATETSHTEYSWQSIHPAAGTGPLGGPSRSGTEVWGHPLQADLLLTAPPILPGWRGWLCLNVARLTIKR